MAAKHPRKAEEVLNSLKRLKPELQARYYVKNICLFGSVLRGEQ
jgi:predicted nucleotidyltransferase